ncbi:MAG: 50S ribosomal protein L21 [Chloroflexi bacterium]|nr:50S ribosomal protein L21 [Chloroflexota bacterium]
MYAVMETGGKQYKVSPGDQVKIEKVEGKKGDEVILNRVLMVVGDNQELKPGAPYIQDAQVKATILSQSRERKVTVFKYKRRKRYHVKRGHRQPYTLVEIESIEASGIKGVKPVREKIEKPKVEKKAAAETGAEPEKAGKSGAAKKTAGKAGTAKAKAKPAAEKKTTAKTKKPAAAKVKKEKAVKDAPKAKAKKKDAEPQTEE